MPQTKYSIATPAKKSVRRKAFYGFSPLTKKYEEAEISTYIAKSLATDISKQSSFFVKDLASSLVLAFSSRDD